MYAVPGIEPASFYCFGSSNKPRQRDFLLLTLTKLGGPCWDRTSTVGFEDRSDIHFTKDPNWYERRGSNSLENPNLGLRGV
jgi:hypothetical protein